MDILLQIAKLTPVVALLVYFIIYLQKEKKKYINDIELLHQELRTSEKENLTALYKMIGFMETFESKDILKQEALLREITDMRKSLEDKIDSFK